MSTMPPPPHAEHDQPGPPGWMFVRDPEHSVLSGVTAGLGHRIGVDPLAVRIALVVLTLAGGVGLVLYGIAWAVSRPPAPGEQVVVHEFDRRQVVAVALVTFGMTLLLRRAGIWLSDALVWPVLVGGAVSAVIWVQSGGRGSTDPRRLLDLSPARVIVASLILFAGTVTFWVVVPSPAQVIVPLAGMAIGVALLAGPFLASAWQRMEQERAELARQQARDEVAAHLHDSVLQTLTLIQRADDLRRTTTLARTQERELRAWLYGDRDLQAAARDLEAAVDDLITDVELHHELDVESVVVGTVLRIDEHRHAPALLSAVREALVNVARHADVATASLYVEVDDERITAFVRDRGVGFDPDDIPPDRHGVRNSIEERLRRHGGQATLISAPGEGTEVEAWVPHDPTWHDDLPEPAPQQQPDRPDWRPQ